MPRRRWSDWRRAGAVGDKLDSRLNDQDLAYVFSVGMKFGLEFSKCRCGCDNPAFSNAHEPALRVGFLQYFLYPVIRFELLVAFRSHRMLPPESHDQA